MVDENDLFEEKSEYKHHIEQEKIDKIKGKMNMDNMIANSFRMLKHIYFRHIKDCQQFYVNYVVDGDTIDVSPVNMFGEVNKKKSLRIRLAYIDAPEAHQEFGEHSTDFLKKLIDKEKVLLHIQGADKYERKIAKIFVNYNNVNKIMLEEGYAILSLYEKYESRLEYKLLESLAKENKKGLWSRSEFHSMRPDEYRKKTNNKF